MKKILVVSTDENIISTVQEACSSFSEDFEFIVKSSQSDIISYINYELPEIKVLDYTCEEVDCASILQAIRNDPWLHYGGVMGVCEDRMQVKQLEALKDPNLISIQTRDGFSFHFARMLRILWLNQQFLSIHGMQEVIGGEEKGSFICGNDTFDFTFYTMFLSNYLYSTNRIAAEDRMNLQIALMELLTNALEHGNLGITQEEKMAYKKKFGDSYQLVEERCADPKYSARQITLMYSITRDKSTFSIKDEGHGFDWKKQFQLAMNSSATHGIALVKSVVDSLVYNESGTMATFTIKNQIDNTNSVPYLIHELKTESFADRQIVCRQGETTNDLFFIVSGRYAVYANRKLVTVLSPSDVFIGEMSFLLNDRRSATIMSVGGGTLIRIPKADFLHLIRRNPHYGLFLSKMLAQRLSKQTSNTIKISNELAKLQQGAKG